MKDLSPLRPLKVGQAQDHKDLAPQKQNNPLTSSCHGFISPTSATVKESLIRWHKCSWRRTSSLIGSLQRIMTSEMVMLNDGHGWREEPALVEI